MNELKKIHELLSTVEPENIELAFALIDGQDNLSFELVYNTYYKKTFEFLVKYEAFRCYKNEDFKECINKCLNLQTLYLDNNQLSSVPSFDLTNLQYLYY